MRLINLSIKNFEILLIFLSLLLIVACGKKTTPTEPTPSPKEDYLKEGWQAYENGNFEQAIANFEKALKDNPQLQEAYNGLGWSYMKLNKIDKAITAFDEAKRFTQENDTSYVSIHVGRGGAYYIKGDIEEAKNSLQKAASILEKDEKVWRFEHDKDITEARVYAQLALCYYKLQDTENAKTYANKASNQDYDQIAKVTGEKIIQWISS
jgi:tetratricopeptide (TPR) repeat protein